jgi:hypothetical protein
VPLIVTLHELVDTQAENGDAKFPGDEVIALRWSDDASKAVRATWAVLAPVVPRARWIPEEPPVSFHPVLDPLRATWVRYDVDYDRIVIDGGSEALTFAAARPHVFAGVIVRGVAADLDPTLVANLAGMPVYVVGTQESAAARTLARGDHPGGRVRIGGADGLGAWLATVRRTLPKSFHWTMKDEGMRLAHWVQVNVAETAVTPTMDVEVVDTAENPNTVRLTTSGVRGLSLLLNDDVVDLGREVRVVVNGAPLKTLWIREPAGEVQPLRLPARLSRSLDGTFRRLRRSLAYGMLFPCTLDGILIP